MCMLICAIEILNIIIITLYQNRPNRLETGGFLVTVRISWNVNVNSLTLLFKPFLSGISGAIKNTLK